MIRNVFTKPLILESAPFVDSINYQVRWRRKPRWWGTAKTKIFRVPTRPEQDLAERDFLFEQFCHYRTAMKAIRKFLHSEVEAAKLKTTVLVKSPEQLNAEFEEAIALNTEWNAECAKIRQIRLEKGSQEKRELILQRLQAKEERDEDLRHKIQETIEKEQRVLHTFITEENIDQAIEKALTNITDYNFAIDLDGKRYPGSTSELIEQKQ